MQDVPNTTDFSHFHGAGRPVPLAITARLDANLSAQVDRLCGQPALRPPDVEERLDYPAHITLAVLEEGASVERVLFKLSFACLETERVAVRISHVGAFPGSPAHLFLAPVATQSLLALHQRLSKAVSAEPVHPHYLRDAWVPHITLATCNGQPDAAFGAAMRQFEDYRGHIIGIELVRFPPPRIVAHFPLPARPRPPQRGPES
ncbi:2'-5' RNA ligase family protein [Hoeflea olei]|uniref:2'-5' RNA ligase n=1 Tax=Hoeflea olei TaxID=1480615 RepID=A0A1C1Z1K4_9HYPH|nr:2'-5' RNA ligase family protein [Hoeflea olei]OCW59567.1 hypothetical protein AWJ14_11200 [Hoeflea olei]